MAYQGIPEPRPLSQLSTINIVGVYFLWRSGVLVYVGQSKWLAERICQHMAEGKKTFDAFSYLECSVRRLLKIEAQYIEGWLPEYNRCGLSQRARREKPWRITPPPGGKTYAAAIARHFGLTCAQFDWLAKHPKGPKQVRVRIPRKNVRRGVWLWDKVQDWASSNQGLIEEAKTV